MSPKSLNMLKFVVHFRWETIIGTSASTMRKLPLILKCNWVHKEQEIKGLLRNFHTIILDTITISDKRLANLLKELGSHVRYFELEEVVVKHQSFNDILSSLKMLEKLTIVECSINEEVKKINASTITSLKSLVIIRSDWKFFDYFSVSNTQVKELKVASSSYSDSDSVSFENFLSKQAELKSLAIYVRQGDIYKSLAKPEKEFKFKLKTFYVDFKYWGDDSSVDDALLKFLANQQSTLENLETCKSLSEEILEFIMKTLKLKRLIIDANKLPIRPLFYNAIRPNKHLNTLIITGKLEQIEVVRGLLHIYQATRKLVVNSWHDEIINESLVFIANTLKSLHYLEIPTLTADTPELPIPSLKTFHVDFVDEVANWQVFCVNNPSIERLSVKWLTNKNTFTYEVIDAITTQMQNLKHIKFGAYFNPTSRIIELLSRNCQNLQTLEVFAENAVELKNNSSLDGKFKVIYYPPDAVMSVFKEESTMWTEESSFGLDSDTGSDFSDDPDDMSVDYDAPTDDSDGWDDSWEDMDLDDVFFII